MTSGERFLVGILFSTVSPTHLTLPEQTKKNDRWHTIYNTLYCIIIYTSFLCEQTMHHKLVVMADIAFEPLWFSSFLNSQLNQL